MEQKFYIHKDGFIYSGDMTEGARGATQEEIDNHLNPTKTKAQNLYFLDAEYAPQLLDLVLAAVRVNLLQDITEEEREEDLAAISQQYEDLMEEKRVKRSAINNG